MSSLQVYAQRLYPRPAVWLGLIAAVAYSSWPLAFVLNPGVGRHALASQLEAPHQPYNWVFIGSDVLTGVTVMLVGMLQWRSSSRRPALRLGVIGYMLFGFLVAVAALVPLDCDPQGGTCADILRDPFVLTHGFASIVSVLALLGSLILLSALTYRWRASLLGRRLMVVVLSGWLLFGIGSLVELLLHIRGNVLQYFFITLCSLSVFLVIGAVEYATLHQN